MIFNPVAQRLIRELGYQSAYRILAGCMLLCMLPLFLLYRYRPAEMGLAPLGLENGGERAPGGRGGVPGEGMLRSEALKKPAFWASCFVVFGLSASSMGLFNHMQAHFVGIGYEAATASLFISILSLGMTFGKLFFGWLNDRIGTRRNFLLMTTLALRDTSSSRMPPSARDRKSVV